MSNILDFKQYFIKKYSPCENEIALSRIQKFATWLRFLVYLMFLATIVSTTTLLISKQFFPLLSIPGDVEFIRTLNMTDWLVLTLLAFIKPAGFLPIFWQLYHLSTLYQQGVVFTTRNAKIIKSIGLYLMLLDLLFIIQSALVGPILTWRDLTSPFFSLQLSSTYFLIGVFVTLIAKVMILGEIIQKEQEYTV